jgi:hypothetical protein
MDAKNIIDTGLEVGVAIYLAENGYGWMIAILGGLVAGVVVPPITERFF